LPFAYLWSATALSTVGDAMAPIAVTFAILDSHHGWTSLGLVLAALSVTRVVLVLFGGVWSDRRQRRNVMIVADLARMSSQGGLAALVLTGHPPISAFVIAAVISGAGAAFFGPASFGLVAEIVEESDRQRANAALRFAQSSAFIIGPPAAGIVVAALGAGVVIAADAVSFGISMLLLLRVASAAVLDARRVSFVADIQEGWSAVVERPWVLVSILLFAATNFGVAVFYVLGPVVVRAHLGGASAWGVIVGSGGAGGVIGALLATRANLSQPLRGIAVFLVANSFPAFAVAAGLPATIVAVATFLAVGCVAFANVLWETSVQRWVPTELLGRINSYDLLISYIVMPFGYAVAGPLANLAGATSVLTATGCLMLIVCVAAWAIGHTSASRTPAAA